MLWAELQEHQEQPAGVEDVDDASRRAAVEREWLFCSFAR